MNIMRTIFSLLCPLGFLQLSIFGSSKSSSNSSTSVRTSDNRAVTESGQVITGSNIGTENRGTININDPDAVKALAQLSTDAISKTGGAVVELNRASLDANVSAWDKTVTTGANLVDKLIDASTALGSSAIDKFQPAENKAQDATVKLGMFAAIGLVAFSLLRSK